MGNITETSVFEKKEKEKNKSSIDEIIDDLYRVKKGILDVRYEMTVNQQLYIEKGTSYWLKKLEEIKILKSEK
tara:strand:- start:6183 stop:6401 length:219 start_codon:yes stop_codon:yes gene_type:complete